MKEIFYIKATDFNTLGRTAGHRLITGSGGNALRRNVKHVYRAYTCMVTLELIVERDSKVFCFYAFLINIFASYYMHSLQHNNVVVFGKMIMM